MTTAAATWDDLELLLEALRQRIPLLQADYPDEGDFLEAFAGEAEVIQSRAAHDDDLDHCVFVELNHMLVDAGVLPEEQRQF